MVIFSSSTKVCFFLNVALEKLHTTPTKKGYAVVSSFKSILRSFQTASRGRRSKKEHSGCGRLTVSSQAADLMEHNGIKTFEEKSVYE